jgi:hypothetical protein
LSRYAGFYYSGNGNLSDTIPIFNKGFKHVFVA